MVGRDRRARGQTKEHEKIQNRLRSLAWRESFDRFRINAMPSLSEIQALADKIVREFHPEKIILFGSHARGDAEPDSDVDLMVVIDSDEHPSRTAAEITYRVHPRLYPLDLIVRSPETIRLRLRMNDWFLREVMREGRVLYAA